MSQGVRLDLERTGVAWGHSVALRDERGEIVDVPLLAPPEVQDAEAEPLFTYGVPGAIARGWRRLTRVLLGYTAERFARDRVRLVVPVPFRPLIERLSLAQVAQIGASYTGFEQVWVSDHTAHAARAARRAREATEGVENERGETESPGAALKRRLVASGAGRVNVNGGVEI